MPRPIHLDDIHFVISDESATLRFLRESMGACEMGHPDRKIDYVRFMSVRYGHPTLTVTGPVAANEPDALRRDISSLFELYRPPRNAPARYGVRSVVFSTRDLADAVAVLRARGVEISAEGEDARLPYEPTAKSASFLGPDGIRLGLVERSGDRGSRFGIDHLVMLTRDAAATSRFFQQVFSGVESDVGAGTRVIRVADARIVLAEPEALGIPRESVRPPALVPFATPGSGSAPRRQRVPGSIEHLGFLFADVPALAAAAESRGYRADYPPVRYEYAGRLTPYTVTEFSTPDGYGIEAVAVAGRVGPHAYYEGRFETHE